ncbi:LysR family transcriptional regulator [Maricaulis sp.]|uniref:LysR family transcriptional regulator n=1 Tax=Maricaulis sp. TaxID=1486257 RepID=UPI00261DB875|nr:LysR family transcriptional regulator [Maricaulis sp.]
MNWQSVAFDWNQIRAFLATVEEGSFSAAARALGQTQPTLSRQITALEEDLGITLFERGRRSMRPTGAALELIDHVRAMGEAAQRVSLTASGQAQSVEGFVSITSTDIVATHLLPPVLERLRALAPKLQIEIIASNTVHDLTKREADIAIRHGRPEQPDLIARLLGETTAGLYGAPSYLDRVGRPQTAEDVSRLDFVGFERGPRILEFVRDLGLDLTPENFRVTSQSGPAYIALIQRGFGLGFVTRDMLAFYPDLEPVYPALPPIPVPVWLVTHRELNTSRKIRLVFDTLAEELKARWAS